MEVLIFWLYLFLEILTLIVFIDVVVSWLAIFWLNLRPKFVWDILDPIYWFISRHIPTNIWPLRFDAFILLLGLYFLKLLILNFFPLLNSVNTYLSNLI